MILTSFSPHAIIFTPIAKVVFIFEILLCKIDSQNPIINMEIDFLFCPKSEKMFFAYHKQEYHAVSFLGLNEKSRFVRLSDALEIFIHEECRANLDGCLVG